MKSRHRVPIWYSALGVSGGIGLVAVGWPLCLLFVFLAAIVLGLTGV